MKRKWIIILAAGLILALIGVGAAYAQEEPGYPVETETATETETPTETEKPPAAETPTETDLPGYPVETEDPTETEMPTDRVDPTETPLPTVDPTEVPDETETPTLVIDTPVCNGTRVHPVLDQLAARFNVAYEELLGYYCNSELGVGEIALALATVQQTNGSVDLQALFSQRLDEDMGWGEIWQSLGLIGNEKNAEDKDLRKNQDRNTHQDQTRNEGEDDQIRNASQYTEQKGSPLVTPPGLEDKETGKPDSPPGQANLDEENDNNGVGNQPGANPGHSEDKPGNGPKP